MPLEVAIIENLKKIDPEFLRVLNYSYYPKLGTAKSGQTLRFLACT